VQPECFSLLSYDSELTDFSRDMALNRPPSSNFSARYLLVPFPPRRISLPPERGCFPLDSTTGKFYPSHFPVKLAPRSYTLLLLFCFSLFTFPSLGELFHSGAWRSQPLVLCSPHRIGGMRCPAFPSPFRRSNFESSCYRRRVALLHFSASTPQLCLQVSFK